MSAEAITMGAFLKSFGAYIFGAVTSLIAFVTMKVKQDRVIEDVEQGRKDLKELMRRLDDRREDDRKLEIEAERIRNQKMDGITKLLNETLIQLARK